MTHVDVKPHPALDPAAWRVLIHPVSGGLLDAAGEVPDAGRPWLNDGFTARMLTDSAILRADDPAFAKPEDAPPKADAKLQADTPTKPPVSTSGKATLAAPVADPAS